MLTGQHCSGHLLVFEALGFSPCVCYKWAFSQFNCHSPAKMTFLEHKSDHVASQFKTYQWPRNKAHFLTQQSRLPRCVVQFISSCPRFTSMKSALVPPIGNNCSHLTSDQSLSCCMYCFSPGDSTYLLTHRTSLHLQLSPTRRPLFLTFSIRAAVIFPGFPPSGITASISQRNLR